MKQADFFVVKKIFANHASCFSIFWITTMLSFFQVVFLTPLLAKRYRIWHRDGSIKIVATFDQKLKL